MPTRDTAPIGAPCWVDLMTSDTERSRAFYRDLFGWTADEPNEEFGGYINFRKNGALVAGCMASQPEAAMPDVWSVHLATDDAAKTLEAATANGGQVYVQPMQVADLGTMAVVSDVGGAAVGAWQPGTFHGFEVFGEAGTPSWFELHTRSYDAAVAFYTKAFAWDAHAMSDTPEFRYTTLGKDDGALAGIMDGSGYLTDADPGGWSVYFGTDDTDKSLARIVDLGGAILQPAEDTPYGRLAEASDPTGARFKLVKSP
jgi:uncharacterized protein